MVLYASLDELVLDQVRYMDVQRAIVESIVDEFEKESLDNLSVFRSLLAGNTRRKRSRLWLEEQYKRGGFAGGQNASRRLQRICDG